MSKGLVSTSEDIKTQNFEDRTVKSKLRYPLHYNSITAHLSPTF